jgi:hypothetical protein
MFPTLTLFALLAAGVIFVPSTTYADTYINYDVDASFSSGATLTGTFTIDAVSGDVPYSSNGPTYITAANLTVTEPDSTTISFGCPNGFAANNCIIYDSVAGYTQYGFSISTSPSQILWLTWPISSSTDSFSFLPGAYSVGSYCYGCVPGQMDYLTSGGAIDPPATEDSIPTPEPTTGLLLISALPGLGFLGFRRRGAAE